MIWQLIHRFRAIFALVVLTSLSHFTALAQSFSSFNPNGSVIATVPHSSSLNLVSTATIEAWVFLTNNVDAIHGHSVVTKGADGSGNDGVYEVLMVGSNQPMFRLGRNCISCFAIEGPSLSLNTWYHLAMTFNGNTLKGYVNGQLVGVITSGTYGILQNTTNLTIGRRDNNSLLPLPGLIDELRIWNVERSASEIQANMVNNVSGQSGLVGYWQFNEGTNTTANDASGNNNTATLSGSSWSPKNILPLSNFTNDAAVINTVKRIHVSELVSTGSISISTSNPSLLSSEHVTSSTTPYKSVSYSPVANQDGTANVSFTLPLISSTFGTSTTQSISVTRTSTGANFGGYAGDFSNGGSAETNTNPITVLDNYTVSFWIYPISIPLANNSNILINGNGSVNGFGLLLGSGNDIRILFGGNYIIDTWQYLSSTKWQHITYSRQSGMDKIYINGQLVFNQNFSGPNPYGFGGVSNLTVGDWASRFIIDDIRLWNIALSDQEILNSVYTPVSGSPNGLVGSYQFNEGLGQFTQNLMNPTLRLNLSSNVQFVSSTRPAASSITHPQFSTDINNLDFSILNAASSELTLNATLSGMQTLLFGHNNQTSTFMTSSTPGVGNIFKRIWRVESNTNVSNASCSVNFGIIPSNQNFGISPDNLSNIPYMLCVSDSPTFSEFRGYPLTMSGAIGSAQNIDLRNGMYMTIRAGNTGGKMLTFSANNSPSPDNISVTGASLSISGPITVSAWIRPSTTSLSGTRTILGRYSNGNGGYALELNNGRVQFSTFVSAPTSAGQAISTTSLQANQWYHITGQYDGTNVRIFINGILSSAAVAGAAPTANPSARLTIGVSPVNTTASATAFDGSMDEVQIWNSARTASQILTNALLGAPANSANLVLNYSFEEGSGKTVYDATANANHGLLLPASPTFGPSSAPFATNLTASQNELTAIWDAQPVTNSSIMTLNSSTGSFGTLGTTGVIAFGHNGAAITYNVNDIPGDVTWRVQRVWRIEQQGTPTTTVQFDLSSFLINDPSQIRVLVDEDGIFANGATQLSGTYNASTKVFTSLLNQSLPNGAFITICTRCATCP